ncbi:hypothetical protein GGR21_000778 [Dysgonomonas hofstadii]|uniref:DUF6046 domain-containing protein n=1 Tax=Dysgonomonas hofstadii TaxID=637886 RepID=A0A840CI57_9BACT|nr:DUF6046 domain-containing protein [Dysgonomonas hofstadii]MBB4034891.1 hypothetical protein [Dysgonomonas hofstadii]
MDAVDRTNALIFADAIRHIFGINTPIYIPWGKNVPYEAGEFSNIQFVPEETILEELPTSEFGTNVFGAIMLEGGEYNMYDHDGSLVKKRFGDYTLPYSCIASFTRESNITKTEVLGSTGTVKEIYGKGDWQITIRGIAFNRRNGEKTTAHEQISTLSKWANVCDSIGVKSSMFRSKEIYNIVIETFSVQPIIGQWDAIPFQIDAISDEPIELYLP